MAVVINSPNVSYVDNGCRQPWNHSERVKFFDSAGTEGVEQPDSANNGHRRCRIGRDGVTFLYIRPAVWRRGGQPRAAEIQHRVLVKTETKSLSKWKK